jgi:hypothetical protein
MAKQSWQQWVRSVERDPNTPSKLRKGSLAALTGPDVRVLDAFVACLKLHCYCDNPRVALAAARLLLGEMQESTRWIARELIPFAMNWEDRERLWPYLDPQSGNTYVLDDEYGDPGNNELERSHP